MNKTVMYRAFFDEMKKTATIGTNAAKAVDAVTRRKAAVEGMMPELLPGITAGLGAGLAAYYNKSPSAGAAMGGAIGAIPFLVKGKG